MRNRIISLIMILMFLMSGFTPAAFASDETETPVISKDFEFAKAVGIFRDEYVPNEAISRIELAKCFSNILLNGIEPAKDIESAFFDDLDYENAGYGDAMARAGIMNGVGERVFSPEGKVTYMQLLKTFVSFLGYDVKAQALGGYPSGYMTIAAQLDITDKNSPYLDSFVTYETLATMFKRALNVPLFRVVSYNEGALEYSSSDNMDYLRKYLKIFRYSEVVNAVYNSNIINNKEIQYDEIILGNTVFRFDPKTTELYDKLGYTLEVFYRENGTEAQIICFDEYNNNVVELSGDEVEGYYDGNLLYSVDNKEKRIKINTETNVIYNGKLCDEYNEDIFNQWQLTNKDGTLKAIDNNSDGKFDFVIIDAYESYVVDTITNDAIIPMYRSSVVIDISSYTQGEEVLFRNIKGKPVSIDSVVSGSIISVSKALDGTVTNIVVTADTYTGEVEEIEVENGKHYITIGGNRYNPSACLSYNPQLSRLRPGEKVTMMFNKGGLLSDIETLKFQQVDTAYLMDAKTGKGLENSEMASIKLFSSGGFFSVHELAKKVEVLYGEEIRRLNPAEVLALFGYEKSGKIKRQPFMYKKNKDGQIIWMSMVKENSGPVDGFYKYNLADIGLSSSPKLYASSFEGKLLLNSTAIFYVPNEENRDDDSFYKVKTSLPNNNSGYADVEIYGSKKESRIAAAVVLPATSKSSGETQVTMIVDSVASALDSEGIPSVKVTGFVSGAKKDYFGSADNLVGEKGSFLIDSGDVLAVKADKENRIIEFDVLFDRSEKKLTGTSNPTVSRMDEQFRYLYGRLDWSDEESFLVEIDDGQGNLTKDVYLKSSSYRYYICEDLGSKGVKVRTCKFNEVFAYPEGYTKENNIFMWTNYGTPQIVVIYK